MPGGTASAPEGRPGEREARDTVFTVGHSTRSAEDLIGLLREAGVEQIVDVRRHPGSRRNPQHGREALAAALERQGLHYLWLGEGLGGRQPETLPPERSPNRAWREPAFRRYADAMTTPSFREAFARLEARAAQAPAGVMCAEKLWWRCHRRLLADLLHVRGWRVVHLLEPGRRVEHALSPWARLSPEGELHYPALV